MTTEIIPTNLGKPATLHVEAIINNRQIGVAVVNGHFIQCSDRKWSTQTVKAGYTVETAAEQAAALLLSKGGVRFV